jgi:hypothetical protein
MDRPSHSPEETVRSPQDPQLPPVVQDLLVDLEATNPSNARAAMIFILAMAAAHPETLAGVVSYEDPTETTRALAERFPTLPGAGALTKGGLVVQRTATPEQIRMATDMGRDPDQPWSAAHDGY